MRSLSAGHIACAWSSSSLRGTVRSLTPRCGQVGAVKKEVQLGMRDMQKGQDELAEEVKRLSPGSRALGAPETTANRYSCGPYEQQIGRLNALSRCRRLQRWPRLLPKLAAAVVAVVVASALVAAVSTWPLPCTAFRTTRFST